MLALSCKRLLSVSKLVNIQVPDRNEHVVYLDLMTRAACGCENLKTIMRRLKKNDSRSLCIFCYKYLPTSETHWSAVFDGLVGSSRRFPSRRDEPDPVTWSQNFWDAVPVFGKEGGGRCPKCSYRSFPVRK